MRTRYCGGTPAGCGTVDPQRGVRHPRAAHNVRFHSAGIRRFHHRVVGALIMSLDDELSADAGLTTAVHPAEPGSPPHDALNVLASWATTLEQAEAANAVDGL